MVPREVAFGKVHGGVGLIIKAVVDLRGVAEVRTVLVVDDPVEPAVVSPLKKGTRNCRRGLIRETVRLRYGKLSKRYCVHRLSLVFTFAFEGQEAKQPIFLEWASGRPAELLTCIVWMRGNRAAWVSWRWPDASGILLIGV